MICVHSRTKINHQVTVQSWLLPEQIYQDIFPQSPTRLPARLATSRNLSRARHPQSTSTPTPVHQLPLHILGRPQTGTDRADHNRPCPPRHLSSAPGYEASDRLPCLSCWPGFLISSRLALLCPDRLPCPHDSPLCFHSRPRLPFLLWRYPQSCLLALLSSALAVSEYPRGNGSYPSAMGLTANEQFPA